MTDELDQMGPVDYLVVEFPGNRMTGEGLPLLVDLVDRGIIRILDLVFVMKELDGNLHGLAIADFDGDGQLDLAVFEGASSGLLDEEDIEEAAACSSRAAPRASWSTRTSGPPVRPGAAAWRWSAGREWSHPGPGSAGRGGRGRGSRRDLTPRRRRPEHKHRKGKTKCRTYSGGRADRRHRRTATAVSNRVSRRQAGRWAEQEQQQAYQQPAYARHSRPPPHLPAAASGDGRQAGQLKELGQLKDQGVLTDAEFEAQKSRILTQSA